MAENEDPRIRCSPVKELGSPTKASLNKEVVHTSKRTPLRNIGNSSTGVISSKQNIKTGVTPSRYEALEQLDEEAGWQDRTEVVTRLDHAAYNTFAREVLEEAVTKALTMTTTSQPTRINTELIKPEDGEVAASQYIRSACTSSIDVLQRGGGNKVVITKQKGNPEEVCCREEKDKAHTLEVAGEGNKQEKHPGETRNAEEFFDTVENVDEIPVSSKYYQLNMWNASSEGRFDPFKTRAAVMNSPCKITSATINGDDRLVPLQTDSTLPKEEAGQTVTEAKSEDKPEEDGKSISTGIADTSNVDLSLLPAKMSGARTSEKEILAGQDTKRDTTVKGKAPQREINVIDTKESQPQEAEDIIIPSKGYNLDFLDNPNCDPFKTESSVNNSPDKTDCSSLKKEESISTKAETKEPEVDTAYFSPDSKPTRCQTEKVSNLIPSTETVQLKTSANAPRPEELSGVVSRDHEKSRELLGPIRENNDKLKSSKAETEVNEQNH